MSFSSLFENSKEIRSASTVAMVEDVLAELGHPVDACRTGDSTSVRAWRVVHGSAGVSIRLTAGAEYPHLRIASRVMRVPADIAPPLRASLHTELLTRNLELCGMAFAVDDDEVLLVTERSTRDLDRSEVLDLIHRVQTHADQVDDALAVEYGGTLGP